MSKLIAGLIACVFATAAFGQGKGRAGREVRVGHPHPGGERISKLATALEDEIPACAGMTWICLQGQ